MPTMMIYDEIVSSLVRNYLPGALIVAILTWTTFRIFSNSKSAQNNNNRLPPMLPGSILSVIKGFTSPDAPIWLLECTKQLNSTIFRMPLNLLVSSPCLCIVGDVTTARQILQDTSSTKPYAMYRLFDQMSSGVSFFTSEGTRYHHVRKSASVAFNTRVIQTTIETVVKEKLSAWINHTLPTMQDSVDIVTEMQLLTVRIIAQAQFEYDLQRDEAIEIKSHLQLAIDEYGSKCALQPWREWFWFAFEQGRQAKRATQLLKSTCRKFLEHHRRKNKSSGDSSSSSTSIVALLDNDSEYNSDEERLSDMVVFFLAGYDTTAHSLAFLLKSIAKNPNVQRELRNELLLDPNPYNSSLMRHSIKESARLNPVASLGSARVVHRDMELPNNMFLPKNSVAAIPFYLLGHNEAIFERPDDFLPRRWESATEAMNASIIPFSIGRRNCIGQALATSEQFWIVSQLVRDYEITLVDEGTVAFCITLTTKGTKLAFCAVK